MKIIFKIICTALPTCCITNKNAFKLDAYCLLSTIRGELFLTEIPPSQRPTFLDRDPPSFTETSWTETPWTEETSGQLDRDPLQKYTQVGPPDRDPSGQRPLDKDAPWIEILPGQRHPWTETPQTKTPPPDRDHSPWTDKHLWKHYLRKLRLRAVKILEYLHCYAGDTACDMTNVQVRIFIVYRLTQPNGAALLHKSCCHGN